MSKGEKNHDINEDVCLFIKIIKRTLITYETIMAQTQQQGDISQLMHKIASQNKLLLEIATRNKLIDFNLQSQYLESMKIKMKEWLIANKGKYCNGTVFKDIRTFISQLQIALTVFQKNGNFVHMVTKVYTIICEHLKHLKVKFDLFHTQTVQKSLQLPLNVKVRKAQSLFLSSRFTPEIRSIKLSSLYGLEIDNSYLKSLSIQCIRSQLQGVQMQLQRNRFIAQQIQMHIRLFYLFVNRSKIKGKSRSELYAKQPTFKSIRIKTTFQDRPCHNFNIVRGSKGSSFKENGQEQVSKTKMALKINNVYVSGNQFDIYCDNSTHSLFRIANTNKKKTVFLTRALRDPLISIHINGDSKQFMPA